MKKLIVILFLLELSFSLFAQDIEWSNIYGGSNDDYGLSIQQTSDYGFIVAGRSFSSDGNVTGNHGSQDYWIMKLDVNGNTLWTKCYGGSNDDIALQIQQTTDNGYIVLGYSNSNDGDVHGNHSSGVFDYWILKLDENGDTLWSKCYGGSQEDFPYSIKQTIDNGYIVVGNTNSSDGDVSGFHGGFSDSWILRLDSNGDILWTKCYGGTSFDEAYSVQITTDSLYIIAGWTTSTDEDIHTNHGGADSWLLKLDLMGDTLWTKCYGGSGFDYSYFIQQISDSGFVVAGHSQSNDCDVSENNGGWDSWILRLDSNGNIVWTKSYGGSGDDFSYNIKQTLDGGFIAAGYSNSTDFDVVGNHGGIDAWIIKLDANGDTLWTHCYGGSYNDYTYDILQSNDGGFILAGGSESSDGDLTGNHGMHDYWIFKLNNITTVSKQNIIRSAIIYPNPTTGIIKINSLGVDSIEVINLQGKQIYIGKEHEIDLRKEPEGIYIIKILTSKQIITQKLLKL